MKFLLYHELLLYCNNYYLNYYFDLIGLKGLTCFMEIIHLQNKLIIEIDSIKSNR